MLNAIRWKTEQLIRTKAKTMFGEAFSVFSEKEKNDIIKKMAVKFDYSYYEGMAAPELIKVIARISSIVGENPEEVLYELLAGFRSSQEIRDVFGENMNISNISSEYNFKSYIKSYIESISKDVDAA